MSNLWPFWAFLLLCFVHGVTWFYLGWCQERLNYLERRLKALEETK